MPLSSEHPGANTLAADRASLGTHILSQPARSGEVPCCMAIFLYPCSFPCPSRFLTNLKVVGLKPAGSCQVWQNPCEQISSWLAHAWNAGCHAPDLKASRNNRLRQLR